MGLPKDEITADDLTAYTMEDTGIWIGLEGCLEEMDKWAREFHNANDKGSVMAVARMRLMTFTDELESKRANYYVTTMAKLQKDAAHAHNELARIRKVLKGDVKESQKMWLTNRKNILLTFVASMSEPNTLSDAQKRALQEAAET